MCNSVLYHGKAFNTPRELATLIGGEDRLVWSDKNPFVNWPVEKDWHDLDLCLCPVDLEATLKGAGFHWTRGADPMEWFAEKNATTT